MNLIEKVFGTHSERELKMIRPIVTKIESLRPEMMAMSDEEQEAEQVGFFDGESDVVHTNAQHHPVLWFLYVHQIFRVIPICLLIDCSLQFLNGGKMVHDWLCRASQSLGDRPGVDVLRTLFTSNRKGGIHHHLPCVFRFRWQFAFPLIIIQII